MEKFKYYVKRLFKVFLYSHFGMFMTVMLSITTAQFFVDMDSAVGRVIFEMLVFLFWVFVMGLVGMAFGGRQYKKMKNNEYRRKPDSRDLLGYYEDREDEFATANGFLLGLFAHYPMYLCYLLFACGLKKFSFAAIVTYSAVVSSPVYEITGGNALWIALLIVPVSMLVTGAGYLLARAKIRAQERHIQGMEDALTDAEGKK